MRVDTVAIQRNPTSGAGGRNRELVRMISGLRAAGLRPLLFSNRDKLARRFQYPEFRSRLLCIVAAGGDGTVDDLINRYPGVPLAIFAMGTENLLAKYCAMPHDGGLAAQVIADRFTRQIDLGMAGRHRFAVMASCGFDAAVVELAHAARRGRITKLHYIRPILKTLLAGRSPTLHIYCDQTTTPRECQLAIISNISRYALNLPVNPQACDHDGLFHVCLIENAAPTVLIRHFLRGLLTGRIQASGVSYLTCRNLRIKADTPVPVQADGDPIGHTPLEFRVLPAALELIVPQQFATGRLEVEELVQTVQA